MLAAKREQRSFKFFPTVNTEIWKISFLNSFELIFFSLVYELFKQFEELKRAISANILFQSNVIFFDLYSIQFDRSTLLPSFFRATDDFRPSFRLEDSSRFEKSIFPSLIFLPLCGFLFPVIDAQPCFHLYSSNIRISYNESETKEKVRLDIFLTFLHF